MRPRGTGRPRRGRSAINKIAPDHLSRETVVYIRQSTHDQLLHNHESRRSHYGLADRARGLGCDEPVVIVDDLGRSGRGTSRPGFERLLVAIRCAVCRCLRGSSRSASRIAPLMPVSPTPGKAYWQLSAAGAITTRIHSGAAVTQNRPSRPETASSTCPSVVAWLVERDAIGNGAALEAWGLRNAYGARRGAWPPAACEGKKIRTDTRFVELILGRSLAA